MVIEYEKPWVVIRLTPEEAAILARYGTDALSTATGESETTIELELRRMSDFVEGKQ